MITKAIVAGIGESWIDCLSLDETERAYDESCGGGGSCGSTGCGCRVSGQPFKAAIPGSLDIKVGDTVEIAPARTGALLGSLAVLGIPILGGVAGWFAATRFAPGLPDGAKAGVAAVGLIAAAGITVLIGGRNKNQKLPEITAVKS